jgi:hypothetical protein
LTKAARMSRSAIGVMMSVRMAGALPAGGSGRAGGRGGGVEDA